MRYAIVSDIHGNYEALKAVMNDISKKKVNRIISLGDVVGYGPQPHECIKVMMDYKIPSVLGNHEAGVILKTDLKIWREEATITWADARQNLCDKDYAWLQDRPYRLYYDNFMVVHGSPKNPIKEYLSDIFRVWRNAKFNPCNICFYGHTHEPVIFESTNSWFDMIYFDGTKKLNRLKKYFINPGSVGQPRDGDERASYLIFDEDAYTVSLERADYNILRTQLLIGQKHYPKILAERLNQGW